MKKLFLVLIVVGLFGNAVFTQKTTRVKFKRGAVSAVVSGYLSGYKDEKSYIMKVRAGQTLRTEQVGGAHSITIFIQDPSGADVTDSDASCNNRKEVRPTIAGDYKIIVVECQKADVWRGTFRFRVTVR